MDDELAKRLKSLECMSMAIELSSPSGHMSKRARKAALQRFDAFRTEPESPSCILFPPRTEREKLEDTKAHILREKESRPEYPNFLSKELRKVNKALDKLATTD